MNIVKTLLNILLVFSAACFAQNQYDLIPGTSRYYDGAQEYSWILLGNHRGIEEVIGDTLIEDNTYSVVKWKSEYIADTEDKIIITKDTSFYRCNGGVLYKYTLTGDSVVQDFSFSKGDSIRSYYSNQDLASFKSYPPKVIIYDTLVTFTDGSEYRIFWGDDTTHFYNTPTTIIPDKQTFLDSILIDRGETWLLPFGGTQTYFPYKPFYFIDSLGILYSEWNYRKMALVGVKKPNGTLYGQEINFITNIDEPKRKLGYFELYQNYPNPFNPETQISFTLNIPSEIKIEVYNLLGQKITSLFDGKKPAGNHKISFNAKGLSSGVYFYRITSNEFSSTRKMLYVQ